MAARERLARVLYKTGAFGIALRARARVRAPILTVLTYHHVHAPGDGYPFDPDVADATPEQFLRHLELLARHFHVIGIDELCRGLDGDPLPPNPALITFDDGYRSCHDVALPLLRRVGLSAVFFVATSFVSERRLYWWERIAYVVRRARTERVRLTYPEPRELDLRAPSAAKTLVRTVKNTVGLDVERYLEQLTTAAGVDWDRAVERRLADELIMTWDQIRALRAAGMDIESHTRRHHVLQTLAAGELAAELAGARVDIEREIGRPVRAIAYPVGRPIAHVTSLRAAVAAAGYRIGFSNGTGASIVRSGLDPLDVRRIALDRDTSDAMFLGQAAIPPLGFQRKGDVSQYFSA